MIHDTRFVAHSAHEDKIERWLDIPDASTNLNKARKERHHGTGAWFLQTEEYIRWKARDYSTLWLHGIAGCGKTVLSSTVIQDLEAGQTGSEAIILYFYFDFSDARKQSFEKMVRTLAFQLNQRHEACRQRLDELYSSCKGGHEQPQGQVVVAALHDMLEMSGRVTVVLDALDECETRKELLSWLAVSATRPPHIFLTSRIEEDLKSSLSEWVPADCIVPVQQRAVDEDIRTVVRSVLAQDEDLNRWENRPDVRAEIENKLMEKPDGM